MRTADVAHLDTPMEALATFGEGGKRLRRAQKDFRSARDISRSCLWLMSEIFTIFAADNLPNSDALRIFVGENIQNL